MNEWPGQKAAPALTPCPLPQQAALPDLCVRSRAPQVPTMLRRFRLGTHPQGISLIISQSYSVAWAFLKIMAHRIRVRSGPQKWYFTCSVTKLSGGGEAAGGREMGHTRTPVCSQLPSAFSHCDVGLICYCSPGSQMLGWWGWGMRQAGQVWVTVRKRRMNEKYYQQRHDNKFNYINFQKRLLKVWCKKENLKEIKAHNTKMVIRIPCPLPDSPKNYRPRWFYMYFTKLIGPVDLLSFQIKKT